MKRVNSRAIPVVHRLVSAPTRDRPTRRAAMLGLGVMALGLAGVELVGCGGPPPKTAFDVLKTPDERTAIAWIARAFRKRGLEVESGRVVQIADGLQLVADVAAVDAPWGVAWLRTDEHRALKAGHLPAPPPDVAKGALWVHRGVGDDADERVLVLIDQQFQYDPDPRGDGVVRSIQEAEARAVRDVLDFLVRAQGGALA